MNTQIWELLCAISEQYQVDIGVDFRYSGKHRLTIGRDFIWDLSQSCCRGWHSDWPMEIARAIAFFAEKKSHIPATTSGAVAASERQE